jgi:hypothetical protein
MDINIIKALSAPACPACEEERRPGNSFFSLLVAPARRALENNNITSLQQLSKFSEAEILEFHGIGSSSIPKLKMALKKKDFHLKANKNYEYNSLL